MLVSSARGRPRASTPWRWRHALAVALALAVLLGVAAPAAAHPGGVDARGCHVARATGVAHCHPERVPPRAPAPPGPHATPATAPRPPIKRSAAAVAAFRRAHPCPATRRATGPCPGWEVDHIVPLACGGPDTPANMQWLTRAANRKKGALGCRRR